MVSKWDMYKGMVSAQIGTLHQTNLKDGLESLSQFVSYFILCYICYKHGYYWAIYSIVAIALAMAFIALKSGDLKRNV